MESVQPTSDNDPGPFNSRPLLPVNLPNPSGDVTVNVLKKYTLVKFGNVQLAYDANGDIVKEISLASPNSYSEYIRASNGSGMTIMRYGNNKVFGKTLILFDAQKRAKMTVVNDYDQTGKQVNQVEYDYQYNAAGNLQSIVSNKNQQYTFSYDGSGNVTKVDISDNGKKQVMQCQFNGAMDKTHLNPYWIMMNDQINRYLPIYGKFSNKLLTSYKVIDLPSNSVFEDVTYNYDLNSDGMPISTGMLRKIWGTTTNNSFAMEYDVTVLKP
ncbi:hypothetical protein GCM10028809_23070 [Spirosoma gilvum]